jgi:hypothetical protein
MKLLIRWNLRRKFGISISASFTDFLRLFSFQRRNSDLIQVTPNFIWVLLQLMLNKMDTMLRSNIIKNVIKICNKNVWTFCLQFWKITLWPEMTNTTVDLSWIWEKVFWPYNYGRLNPSPPLPSQPALKAYATKMQLNHLLALGPCVPL